MALWRAGERSCRRLGARRTGGTDHSPGGASRRRGRRQRAARGDADADRREGRERPHGASLGVPRRPPQRGADAGGAWGRRERDRPLWRGPAPQRGVERRPCRIGVAPGEGSQSRCEDGQRLDAVAPGGAERARRRRASAPRARRPVGRPRQHGGLADPRCGAGRQVGGGRLAREPDAGGRDVGPEPARLRRQHGAAPGGQDSAARTRSRCWHPRAPI